jgi:hypothetical protein
MAVSCQDGLPPGRLGHDGAGRPGDVPGVRGQGRRPSPNGARNVSSIHWPDWGVRLGRRPLRQGWTWSRTDGGPAVSFRWTILREALEEMLFSVGSLNQKLLGAAGADGQARDNRLALV